MILFECAKKNSKRHLICLFVRNLNRQKNGPKLTRRGRKREEEKLLDGSVIKTELQRILA